VGVTQSEFAENGKKGLTEWGKREAGHTLTGRVRYIGEDRLFMGTFRVLVVEVGDESTQLPLSWLRIDFMVGVPD